MIGIDQLYHHPDNPRKDLGDLTELADSIRENGILQNLTVIAGHWMSSKEYIQMAKAEGVERAAALGTYTRENSWTQDGYTVVIGNRRMEAARIAGLDALPCVISDMDYKTQVATMLMENMQRSDLTVFEQAEGFQMMMDLGFNPKEIGEKTGFSEKTVKERCKLTKLNKKNFENAVGKGATLIDMIEISRLESKNDQNEVMREAGTNNFRQVLKRKIGEQKYRKNCERLGKIAQEEGLRTIPEGMDVWENFSGLGTPTGTYESEDKIRKAIRKMVKGNAGAQLFYQFSQDWQTYDARLQMLKIKEKNGKEQSAEEKAQKEKDRERQKKVREVKKLWAEAYRLRTDFIREYTVANGAGMTTIGKIITKYALSQQNCWNKQLPGQHHWNHKYIVDTLGIRPEEYEDKKSIFEMVEEKGIPLIRATLAWINGGGVFDCDGPECGDYYYYDGSYQKNNQWMMKERYEFLIEIGYKMSDLEIQLMDGTHPIYGKEAG